VEAVVMIKEIISAIYRVILPIFLVLSLTRCFGSDGGDGGNIGWVTITEPTTSDTYTATDVTTINLAGETFLSPGATTKQGTVCDCVGLACFFIDDVQCVDYTYYDSGVTVTVTNQTTGDTAIERLTSRSGFITHWSTTFIPVVPNDNVIQVRAADDLGNWGTSQITVYMVDTIPPTVLSTRPENNWVAYTTSAITVTFSEVMDTSTITTSSFTVSDGGGNISGTISFSDGDTVATFTPSANLSYSTTYTVTLNSIIQDLAGNTLTATPWSFTTVLESTPSNVQATADDGQVMISWAALPGADYYNIYFDTNPDVTTSSGTLISGITSTFYTHSGLTNGDTYYYIVTAVSIDGESPASTFASAMAGLVIKQFGTADTDRAYDIAVDTAGNNYSTGSTDRNIFIAKYDNSDNQLWIKQLGTADYDSGHSVTVDATGNIYVTGEIGRDVFIAKYDNSGNQLWIKLLFNTATYDTGYGIAVDATGNIYVTGQIDGDIFIIKCDNSGNQLWIKQFSTIANDQGSGIAVDAAGNIYVTGYTYSDIAGTGNAGLYDVFIAKYDTSGNQLWIKQFGTADTDRAYDIAVDAAGNSYVTGYTDGGAFIAKYDNSGNQLWIKQDGGYGVTMDATENIYVTGGVVFAKYDTSGNQLWIKQFGTIAADKGRGIAVDAAGNIYVTGYTLGDLAGTGNAGVDDVFIVHLYP
jgi:hypothetical protein